MNYGKKKKMKDGGMARKVHDATMRAMKDIDPADYSKSVKNFKKDYESVSKKIKESMKTGKSGMKAGGMAMKDVPMDKKKNLGKLPEEVRNKMGFNKAGGKVKKMKEGGGVKKAVSEGLKKAAKTGAGLGAAIAKVKKKQAKDKSPKVFRGDPNKDGTFKKGGMAKKKMMGGGMAMKYKHGGKVGKKCPRDGIAMRGKTRA